MQIPLLDDRRRFEDRRLMDEGPPPGETERRMRPERRSFEVEKLQFDEWVAPARPGGRLSVSP
jgi:hypothetical protein